MDLGSFWADDSYGGASSWADEEIDMASIGVPTTGPSTGASTSTYKRQESFGSSRFEDQRQDRQEYPIPDEPPYRARVGNLPWEVTEDDLARFLEDRMQIRDAISEIKLPVDTMTGKLRGFGFVTFKDRDVLEESLRLTLSDFNGRKIFVNVAAPQKQDVFEMDWRASRGPLTGGSGRDRGDRPRREEVEIDWTSARGQGTLPPREPRDRMDRGDRPRREEPDIDWSSARGKGVLPPREPRERSDRPRREEPEIDWSSARGQGTLPPREPRERSIRTPKRDEPEFDWSSARGLGTLPPRERSNRTPKKAEPVLDWKRGQTIEPRKPKKDTSKPEEEKEQPRAKKSLYEVLAVEGDGDDESDDEPVAKKTGDDAVSALESKTSELSVDDKEGWSTVKK